jgi:hypothetical protein
MNNDQQAGLVFGGVMATLILGAWTVIVVLQSREKYGVLPRGLRWVETFIPSAVKRVQGSVARVFYGDVIKQRASEKLRMESVTGMTPWWNETSQAWVHGAVTEVKNQHGFVIARRPKDYVNRVATPGVTWDKEQEA